VRSDTTPYHLLVLHVNQLHPLMPAARLLAEDTRRHHLLRQRGARRGEARNEQRRRRTPDVFCISEKEKGKERKPRSHQFRCV
jgi:hypothetical protein